MEILYVVGGIVLLALVLLVVGLTGDSAGDALLEERLGRRAPRGRTSDRSEISRSRRDGFVSAALDRAIQGRSFARNLATQLAQADLKWTVGEFLVFTLCIALSLGLFFYAIGRFVLIPVGVIAGFFAPRAYLGVRKTRRLQEFNGQLSDALNLIVNSLRAGYSTTQALDVIANEMPSPISDEFGRVVLELQLGVPFDTAMANLLRRMPSADMDLIITAMSVQREVGGNLAEVLDAISFTIRERVRIKGEIRTLTSQGRYTGYLITALPFVLGLVIYMINPGFMVPLFSDPCGWLMVGISLVLIVIGYIAINKIVTIEI
jgi:tight adherence protein B